MYEPSLRHTQQNDGNKTERSIDHRRGRFSCTFLYEDSLFPHILSVMIRCDRLKCISRDVFCLHHHEKNIGRKEESTIIDHKIKPIYEINYRSVKIHIPNAKIYPAIGLSEIIQIVVDKGHRHHIY